MLAKITGLFGSEQIAVEVDFTGGDLEVIELDDTIGGKGAALRLATL